MSRNLRNAPYSSIVEDAGDGSGDVLLTIPPEILEQTQWKEGTVLNVSVDDMGRIILKEVCKPPVVA
jgi:hypothetical protein